MVLEKVIIVGPESIHNFFTSYYQDWDTQVPVEHVADVWVGLNNGSLSAESNVVIFTDVEFDDPTEYAGIVETIATFASEAIVLVILYDTANYEKLQADVTRYQQEELGVPEVPFFPISAKSKLEEEIAKAFTYYNTYIANNPSFHQAGSAENVQSGSEPVYGEEENGFVSPPHPEHKRGLIVASTSSKGGSGKTTVGMLTGGMFYLASKAAADQGLREKPLSVVLVDMDIRDGQIGFIIRQLSPTALNIFLLPEKNQETIMDNLVFDPDLNVHALLAPKRAMNADYLTPEFYVYLIDQLADMFDVVVLDTNVDYTDVLLSKVAFPMSDAIMFVTNLSVGSVYGMNRWMEEVTTDVSQGGPGISKSKIGIVVNQALPDLIDMNVVRDAAAGAEILVTIPMDLTGFITKASNSNNMSSILKYHKEVSNAYYKIIRQLMPDEVFADPLIVDENTTSNAGAGSQTSPKAATVRPDNRKKPKRRGLFG